MRSSPPWLLVLQSLAVVCAGIAVANEPCAREEADGEPSAEDGCIAAEYHITLLQLAQATQSKGSLVSRQSAPELGEGARGEGRGELSQLPASTLLPSAAGRGRRFREGVQARTFFSGVPVLNYPQVAEAPGRDEKRVDWIVFLSKDATDSQIIEFCSYMPGDAQCVLRGSPSELGVPFFSILSTEEELKEVLAHHSGATFVELDGTTTQVPEMLRFEYQNPDFVKSDQPGPASWGLDRIDGRHGLDQAYRTPPRSKDGAGVHVYIADTGIRTTHTDFDGRAVPTIEFNSSGAFECRAGDARCAYDATDGHGTHCAGTIGGKTYGVAKQATLHAVKILNSAGMGQWSWFVGALDWVVAHGKKPAIFSASLAGQGILQSVEFAINDAVEAGVTVVVAAGNNADDACSYAPGGVASAITVGAVQNPDDELADYTNYGSCVDLFAPGSAITSVGITTDHAVAIMSGTSMACPHVAGAAALLLGENPSLRPSDVLGLLQRRATAGLVYGMPDDTPNLLLYTGLDSDKKSSGDSGGMVWSSAFWALGIVVAALGLGIVQVATYSP